MGVKGGWRGPVPLSSDGRQVTPARAPSVCSARKCRAPPRELGEAMRVDGHPGTWPAECVLAGATLN